MSVHKRHFENLIVHSEETLLPVILLRFGAVACHIGMQVPQIQTVVQEKIQVQPVIQKEYIQQPVIQREIIQQPVVQEVKHSKGIGVTAQRRAVGFPTVFPQSSLRPNLFLRRIVYRWCSAFMQCTSALFRKCGCFLWSAL
eukprot:19907-Amphidinium_carterae.1